MKSTVFSLLSTAALVHAQAMGPAPAQSLLTSTQSGVIPVAPTPFPGVETIEGAIINDGPIVPGFTGVFGNATVQQNTPGVSYKATLPTTYNFDNATGSIITGSLTATVPANGTGVMITASFSGFPSEAMYGQFVYHIHNLPIGPDGNCSASLGHLDPTNRGELHACDPTQPEECQAGDLSGKHGNITTSTFMASYLDLYLSTNASSPYFFGSKSIVIHSSNVTRLTCANFTMVAASSTSSMAGSTATSTSSPIYTGAATAVSGTLAGGLFAMLFSLLL